MALRMLEDSTVKSLYNTLSESNLYEEENFEDVVKRDFKLFLLDKYNDENYENVSEEDVNEYFTGMFYDIQDYDGLEDANNAEDIIRKEYNLEDKFEEVSFDEIITRMSNATSYEELYDAVSLVEDPSIRNRAEEMLQTCERDGDDVETAYSITTTDCLDMYANDENVFKESVNLKEDINKITDENYDEAVKYINAIESSIRAYEGDRKYHGGYTAHEYKFQKQELRRMQKLMKEYKKTINESLDSSIDSIVNDVLSGNDVYVRLDEKDYSSEEGSNIYKIEYSYSTERPEDYDNGYNSGWDRGQDEEFDKKQDERFEKATKAYEEGEVFEFNCVKIEDGKIQYTGFCLLKCFGIEELRNNLEYYKAKKIGVKTISSFEDLTEGSSLKSLYVYSNAESEDESDAQSMIWSTYKPEAPKLSFQIHREGHMYFVDFIGSEEDIRNYLIKLGWFTPEEIDKYDLIKQYTPELHNKIFSEDVSIKESVDCSKDDVLYMYNPKLNKEVLLLKKNGKWYSSDEGELPKEYSSQTASELCTNFNGSWKRLMSTDKDLDTTFNELKNSNGKLSENTLTKSNSILTKENRKRFKEIDKKISEKNKNIRSSAGSQAVMLDDLPDDIYNEDYYKNVCGLTDEEYKFYVDYNNAIDNYLEEAKKPKKKKDKKPEERIIMQQGNVTCLKQGDKYKVFEEAEDENLKEYSNQEEAMKDALTRCGVDPDNELAESIETKAYNMLKENKNYEDFYKELKNKFDDDKLIPVWNEAIKKLSE